MKIKWFLVPALAIVLSVGTLPAPSPAFASKITDDLRSAIDKVIQIVANGQYKNDKRTRRKLMREAIDSHFNYEQMSMRSLANNWKRRTPEERKEFVKLFGKLLENSYASKIESYSNETIEYVDEIVKGKYALIKTRINRKEGATDVDYKLINQRGRWQIYDFVIEGVSMIKNYRSQFNRIIKKESYNALLDRLTKKIVDLES
ncbi:MAG: phospholipid-binding protein MlaC [Nitrospinales bacterium]